MSVRQHASPGSTRLVWFVVKMAISVGLMIVIFRKLDFTAILQRSGRLSGLTVSSVVLMFALQTYVAAWRWWIILQHHGLGVRLGTALRISLIGAFFNQLLPSSIGGDVARAWYLFQYGSGKRASVLTVLLDRIYGMLALVVLASLFFPVLIIFHLGSATLTIIGLVTVAAASALMTAFWFDYLPRSLQRWALVRHLSTVSEAMRSIAGDRRVIAPLLGLSLLIHGITILAALVLLHAIAAGSNLLLCAALVPVIMLMAMVPISIAGWGVRESIMVYGLGLAGVLPEAALIVSLLIGISLAVLGLVGGVTWLFQSYRNKAQPIA